MRVSREFKCCAGCCWCAGCCTGCSHELLVEAPVGNVIGYVKQKYIDVFFKNLNLMLIFFVLGVVSGKLVTILWMKIATLFSRLKDHVVFAVYKKIK